MIVKKKYKNTARDHTENILYDQNDDATDNVLYDQDFFRIMSKKIISYVTKSHSLILQQTNRIKRLIPVTICHMEEKPREY